MRRVVAAALVAVAVGPALSGRAAASEPPASPADREETRYVLHCGGCHGVDGRGTPGVTPTLHGLAPLAATPAGRRYLMRVPGVAQAPLDDKALAALLDWVIGRFSDAPAVEPFDPVALGRWRASPHRDPKRARAALTPVDGSGGPASRGDDPVSRSAHVPPRH